MMMMLFFFVVVDEIIIIIILPANLVNVIRCPVCLETELRLY
jgi:hypothetical protein